ncbi:DNA-binding protein [Paenibacillus agilis]|uniref:DNA-binding protein n=1 Tax=Paenibacillus agilis TaxID=3020863 RepID=A0A559IYW8_9BACL|nr:DNA-binding protein [Paenibacillus agilis]TVX92803.1 DNA-binding protein [Paenibacillus agilis]
MLGDSFVLVIIIVGLVVWGLVAAYRYWNREEPMEQLYISEHMVHDEEVETLLEREGYDVVGGKFYVPLYIQMDNQDEQMSRIWVDLIVTKHNNWYVVRLVRERMQLDWTTNGVRKLWLSYKIAFPDCEGLLIVNQADRSVKLIRMHVGEPIASGE